MPSKAFTTLGLFPGTEDPGLSASKVALPRGPIISKTICLTADMHYGGQEDGEVATDDIADWTDAVVGLRPDQVLLLGDVANWADNSQYQLARDDLDGLCGQLAIGRVWMPAGGSHDGLARIAADEWRLGWHRILGNCSQCYILKPGNCVLVMVGYSAQPDSLSKSWLLVTCDGNGRL
jgi:hypothetical protein